MRKKIIAFDFDDVICDISRAFLDFNKAKYKQSLPYEKATEYYLYKVLNLKPAEESRRWTEFFKSPKFCYPSPEKNIAKNLKLLKKKYRLVLLTARSKGWQHQVHKWLDRYLPGIFDKLVFSQNLKRKDKRKGSICRQRKFDILIEDRVEEIESCAKCGVKVIVFDRPWNREVSKSIPRIKSLKELSKFL